VATAAVGIPVVLMINSMGGMSFAALTGAAGAIGALEFCQMMRSAGYRPSFLAAIPVAAVAAALPVFVSRPERAWIGLLMLSLMASGTYFLVPHVFRVSLLGWVTTAAAVLYCGIMLGHISLLREVPKGAWWVVVTLLITWGYDTGAYFTGRALGKRGFMQHVSPAKTLEGVIGGLVASSVAGLVSVPALALRPWEGIALGFMLGVLAQIGDLVESMIKRQADVKDSGALFPGHGGLLDRIDSLLFSGVAAYYAAVLLGHAT
jgi:phosphatidate cytidylyltransferase